MTWKRGHVVIAQQGSRNYTRILESVWEIVMEYGSRLGRIMNKGPLVFPTTATTNAYLDSHYTRFPPVLGCLPKVSCGMPISDTAPSTYCFRNSPFSTLVPSTTMIARTLALALGAVLPLVAFAGNVTEGGSCSQSNTYLTPGSFQLNTDCDARTYCSRDGACTKKQCRKDE
jgi:hypothetical protein